MYLLYSFVAVLPVIVYPCTEQQDKAKPAKPAGPGKVKVTVLVILASETDKHIDKQIANIAEEVQKIHKNLKGFKFKAYECQSLARDEKGTFKLVEKKSATVVIRHGADEQNRVGLAVTAPDQDEIEYRSACGKFLPIITRYQTKKNERLILAIRVQPCNGGK